jgi:mannose-6-phosphate isomerase-like protein (cupin superfamily)
MEIIPILMIRHIIENGSLLAVIIKHDFGEPGIHFVTPADLSQQLAYMRHPAGKVIDAHFHNRVVREVHYSQEVLMIRKGRLRVDFYDENQHYVESRILEAGDTILLIAGGHGFEVLEEVEMIEVKQGPHVGEADKTRFPGISADQVRLPRSE